MAKHHWIIICGIQHDVQAGEYSGVRESGPLERDEDGDVDEDDHRGDDSPPDGTPAPPRQRRRGSPPCVSSFMASPVDGKKFSLWSLAFMAMMVPLGSFSMASGDDGPSGRVPQRA